MTFLFGTTLPRRARGEAARWTEDAMLARSLGLRAVRVAAAYDRVHEGSGRFAWDGIDAPLRPLRELGLVPIVTLFDGDVPGWLNGILDPAFPVQLAAYAAAVARRHPWVRHFMPVHQLTAHALGAALAGPAGERTLDDAAFAAALRNLCLGHELAVEAILAARPDAVIVQSEALLHLRAAGSQASETAARWNALRFLALDLTLGGELAPGWAGYLNAHGVASNDLLFFREPRARGERWLALDYVAARERRVSSTGRLTAARQGLGLRRLALEYHARCRLPLLPGTVCQAGSSPAPWLRAQWDDVMALRAAGVPVRGFTWSPLADAPLTLPESAASVRAAVGLVDARGTPRPVGDALHALVQRWRPILDEPMGMELVG